MNRNSITATTLILLLLGGPILILAQEPDDSQDMRSYFLHTRRKAGNNQGLPPRKSPPRRRPPSPAAATGRPQPTYTPAPSQVQDNEEPLIGIGYTFYKSDNSGRPVRVSPSSIFHAGDAVRIVMEPNTDGYLYIFHTENDGKPEMIFPDARLAGGANRIKPHVLYEVPSTKEADPRFRWFYFDNKPATERLYIVVTRAPLPGVPIAGELVAYCQTYSGGCPWRPATDIWNTIKSAVSEPARSSLREIYGTAPNEDEQEAINRGIGLPAGAPEPSVVRLNISGASVLVAILELAHK